MRQESNRDYECYAGKDLKVGGHAKLAGFTAAFTCTI
jgi:hypothetical protein